MKPLLFLISIFISIGLNAQVDTMVNGAIDTSGNKLGNFVMAKDIYTVVMPLFGTKVISARKAGTDTVGTLINNVFFPRFSVANTHTQIGLVSGLQVALDSKQDSGYSYSKAQSDGRYKAIGYTPSSGEITSGLDYTPYNSSNPSGYITGITFAAVTSKPTTIAGYGITDAATSASLTTGMATKEPTITAGATGQYWRGDKTWQTLPATIDTANKWQWLPTFNNAPARSLNSSYQISTTRPARVSYTVSVTSVVSVGQAIAYLEISSNNSTWLTVNQAGETSVSLLNIKYYNLQCDVPIAWYVRIRSAVTLGGAVAYVSGQEVVS